MRPRNGTFDSGYLRRLFYYDRDTGVFIRKEKQNRYVTKTTLSRAPSTGGYFQIKIDGRSYMSHRLAWLYVYGQWPEKFLDHIDGNRENNAISNLRQATNSQNMANSGVKKHNKLGIRGVSYHRHSGLFQAYLKVEGKVVVCKYFKCMSTAKDCYMEGYRKYYGAFCMEQS